MFGLAPPFLFKKFMVELYWLIQPVQKDIGLPGDLWKLLARFWTGLKTRTHCQAKVLGRRIV
jgi:deoxyribodipyrimidine photolyase-like uncharacterized protein